MCMCVHIHMYIYRSMYLLDIVVYANVDTIRNPMPILNMALLPLLFWGPILALATLVASARASGTGSPAPEFLWRRTCSLTQRVQAPKYWGITSHILHSQWLLGAHTTMFGYLDPQGNAALESNVFRLSGTLDFYFGNLSKCLLGKVLGPDGEDPKY